MTAADLIVIGLGAAGSATLYQAAKRGARVIGIDRHHPPHDQGSSHGETRITRQAIGEGEDYAPLALRAHDLWREIEAATGETLFSDVGVLMISAPGLGDAHPGKHDFLERTIACARSFGIAHEILSPEEIRRRFPHFRPAEQELGYFEPGAGMVYPERCIAAQLHLAGELGAEIRCGETVLGCDQTPRGVRVATDIALYEAAQAVVSAGAWAGELLGGAYGAHLALHRQTLHWFRPDEPAAFAPGRFPIFIWMHGRATEDWFYGFPEVTPGGGVKLASEQFARATARAEDLEREVGADEALAVHARHAPGRILGLPASGWLRSRACVYTTAPAGRFLIGRDPGRDRVIVVSACSGHGFKHSPAIGEAVARLALEDETPAVLAPFDPALLSLV
jgi:sarcosine oxidase